MDYRKEYERWIANAEDAEILDQLRSMDEASAEDAFSCEAAGFSSAAASPDSSSVPDISVSAVASGFL